MTVSVSRAGLAAAIAAPLCWSLAGLCIRLIEVSAWAVAGWRSLFMAATIGLVLVIRYRTHMLKAVRAVGWLGLLAGLLLGCCFVFYILAMGLTSVANTLVLLGLGPPLTALLGRLVLGEPIPAFRWASMSGVAIGIAVMFNEALIGPGPASAAVPVPAQGKGYWGEMLAMLSAACFSGATLCLRAASARRRASQPPDDQAPTVLIAGLASGSVAALIAPDFLAVGPLDLGLLAFLGVVQLGLGFLLYSFATQKIPAVQANLLGLLEMVFGPLWVLLAFAEVPGWSTLVGGGLILLSLAGDTVLGARQAAKS